MNINGKKKAKTEIKQVFFITFSLLLIFSLQASPAWSWTADTDQNTPISTDTAGSQQWPMIVSDGANGAIITWVDYRSGAADIYAQRVDSSGKHLWENGAGSGDYDGIPIATAIGRQEIPMIVSDGSGGAIITWVDSRSGTTKNDIYAQRVDSSGNRLWENGAGSGDYDGIPITTATEHQYSPSIVSDGAGGAIIAWVDPRTVTQSDIYAQRVDSSGNRLWENGAGSGDYDGIPISTATGNQSGPVIMGDGSGGAIITWADARSGMSDIYSQRMDANGNRLWENGVGSGDYDGVPVSTVAYYQTNPSIVSSGGGAIITWQDYRSGFNYDIYAQRIDANGNRLWENGVGSGDYDGIPISTAINNQLNPVIVTDSLNGAIIAWQDSRSAYSNDIYAKRVDANGNGLWEIKVNFLAIQHQQTPAIVSDNTGGAIIAWEYSRTGTNYDIHIQRVDSGGNRLWSSGPGGILITTDPKIQNRQTIVSDGANGAIVTWEDYRSGYSGDIYAQRIYSDSSLSTIVTPSNLLPADTAFTGLTPVMTSTSFEDTAGEVTHAASQWQVAERNDFAPDTIQDGISEDDDYIEYTLPFTFPFVGRSITSISVNTNGLIELLEDGEPCDECEYYATHDNGNHLNYSDAIFASNDDLTMVEGYLNIYDQGSYIMIEWFGSTVWDDDIVANPIHFQVEIHSDGTIKWNFKQMDFSDYDYDMYSGVYPNGGTEIDVGYAIARQSSWFFDPTTQMVSEISFNWDIPNPSFLYDSGETSTNLTSYAIPLEANFVNGNSYFWRVRYKTSIEDWTPWSSPTSFTASALFNPYDANQDWVIGDFELLDAIDDWAANNLGDFELLDLIDFWAAGCYHWDDTAARYMAGCL